MLETSEFPIELVAIIVANTLLPVVSKNGPDTNVVNGTVQNC